MPDQPNPSRVTRFRVGDHVRVIGLSAEPMHGMQGVITETLPVDVVYRYRVLFKDGTSEVFFGFELDLIRADRAS